MRSTLPPAASSGCFRPTAPRVPRSCGALGERHALLFSDQIGWLYAVDAEAGTLIWKKRVEDHEAARPTGASIVLDGIVFIPVAS
jgi:outer membrane protein assembly factor BamB